MVRKARTDSIEEAPNLPEPGFEPTNLPELTEPTNLPELTEPTNISTAVFDPDGDFGRVLGSPGIRYAQYGVYFDGAHNPVGEYDYTAPAELTKPAEPEPPRLLTGGVPIDPLVDSRRENQAAREAERLAE